tara:strand:- start:466 stop:948 length:483 start_codon:yes stop_codon:yes gene_type:complete
VDPADALAQKLDAHRRHVLDAAAGKEADSFGATAATYGVTASSPTPEALTAIGEAIVAHCSEALTQVQGQADPRRVTFLRGRLERYASELAQAHQATSGGSKLGLGSIFANATAHAGWTGGHGKVRRVIRCHRCGAAQEQALVFVCSYCGGSVFPTEEKA